jgi:effector-binding domain-containing protein
MRILKYIALLVFLFIIGLSVFVSTQKGDYDVTVSKVINNPRGIVFNYINDYKNWETFCSWIKEDNSYKFTYPGLTMGQGGSSSWTSSSSDGNIKTIAAKENESIFQKMKNNDEVSEVYWTFKDTLGATKVTWRNKGKLDFKSKVKAFFSGGITSVVGSIYEKSLENLNTTLDYEINTYSIKINGITTLPGGYYLKQYLHCKQKETERNVSILVSRMEYFFDKNKISASGKPFIIYHKYDRANNEVAFSVCMPVRDSINVMSGSDIQSGKTASYTSLKTTLVGDYSHKQKAWKKALDFVAKNHLERNRSGQIIEVHKVGRKDVKNPSKWVTEVYIPVYPKAIEVKEDGATQESVTADKPSEKETAADNKK